VELELFLKHPYFSEQALLKEKEPPLVGRLCVIVQWIFCTNFNVLYLNSLSWTHMKKHHDKKIFPVCGAEVARQREGQDLSKALSVIPGD